MRGTKSGSTRLTSLSHSLSLSLSHTLSLSLSLTLSFFLKITALKCWPGNSLVECNFFGKFVLSVNGTTMLMLSRKMACWHTPKLLSWVPP